MTDQPDIQIRAVRPEDLNLVRGTWLHSFGASGRARQMGREYRRVWSQVIDRLCTKSKILVAHPPESPDLIVGWICFEPGIVHYAYVKSAFQRFGVARALLEASGLEGTRYAYTHRTLDSVRITLSRRARGIPTPKYAPLPIEEFTHE